MEMEILVPWSFVWILLQLVRLGQCRVIPYLHKDLVKQSVQRGEVDSPPRPRS